MSQYSTIMAPMPRNAFTAPDIWPWKNEHTESHLKFSLESVDITNHFHFSTFINDYNTPIRTPTPPSVNDVFVDFESDINLEEYLESHSYDISSLTESVSVRNEL